MKSKVVLQRTIIEFQDSNKIVKLSTCWNYQDYFSLKLFNLPKYIYFSPTWSGEKSAPLPRFIQPGVPPRRRNRKFSSALSNSDSQFVHAFRGKHASTSCLSCDFASLHLQLPPFQDAETEQSVKKLVTAHAQRAKWSNKATNWKLGKWEFPELIWFKYCTARWLFNKKYKLAHKVHSWELKNYKFEYKWESSVPGWGLERLRQNKIISRKIMINYINNKQFSD